MPIPIMLFFSLVNEDEADNDKAWESRQILMQCDSTDLTFKGDMK